MRVPINWLKDFVDITLPIEELAERLTFAGLEVGTIDYIGAEWERDKLFVGEIVAVEQHPNADRLVLATVNYGADEPMTVVTGAPNLKVGDSGQRVAFAVAGARLIDGYSEEKKIATLKPSKIRGVKSAGMVCSEKELGLSDYHEGIIILDDDAPVGMPLVDYLGDAVLDIDILPNIARALSMVGVAREVAALTSIQWHKEKFTAWVQRGKEECARMSEEEPFVKIVIDDPDLCPRYSAALVRDVTIKPSPYWMQQRLLKAGMRPINNIVDITNYIMLELGQPLHAFDYDTLTCAEGDDIPTIIMRRARESETMTTLDGNLRQLNTEMLMITDPSGSIALGGIMGGEDTEVTDETRNVLIEAANFYFINNRRTAQLLKLPSEATARFGRGVDPELTLTTLTRTVELMRKYADATVVPGFADNYPLKPKTKRITLTLAEARRIIGIDFTIAEIVDILTALEFECAVEGKAVTVTVPSYRLDVTVPADLLEEIARVYGYDRIPETLMTDELPPQRRNRALEHEERVRDILVGAGLTEVITYTLISEAEQAKIASRVDDSDAVNIPVALPPEECVILENPMTPEHDRLRTTLLPNLLGTLAHNLNFAEQVAIFEVGRVYIPRSLPVDPVELVDEQPRVAIAISGTRDSLSWYNDEQEMMDYFDLKGVVDTLLARLHIEDAVFTTTRHSLFHPGRAARLIIGEDDLGIVGEVHPLVAEEFELSTQRVMYAELDLAKLLDVAPEIEPYARISPYPGVLRDIALVVDADLPAEQVEAAIREAGGAVLVDATLFDVYRGEQLGVGKKSLAYKLLFQSMNRTFRDQEVTKMVNKMIKKLRKELGAEIRS